MRLPRELTIHESIVFDPRIETDMMSDSDNKDENDKEDERRLELSRSRESICSALCSHACHERLVAQVTCCCQVMLKSGLFIKCETHHKEEEDETCRGKLFSWQGSRCVCLVMHPSFKKSCCRVPKKFVCV